REPRPASRLPLDFTCALEEFAADPLERIATKLPIHVDVGVEVDAVVVALGIGIVPVVSGDDLPEALEDGRGLVRVLLSGTRRGVKRLLAAARIARPLAVDELAREGCNRARE